MSYAFPEQVYCVQYRMNLGAVAAGNIHDPVNSAFLDTVVSCPGYGVVKNFANRAVGSETLNEMPLSECKRIARLMGAPMHMGHFLGHEALTNVVC